MVLPYAPLGVNLSSPLLHRLFRGETNDEVLNPRIALPENLAGVRAGLLQRNGLGNVLHEYASLQLQLRLPVFRNQ